MAGYIFVYHNAKLHRGTQMPWYDLQKFLFISQKCVEVKHTWNEKFTSVNPSVSRFVKVAVTSTPAENAFFYSPRMVKNCKLDSMIPMFDTPVDGGLPKHCLMKNIFFGKRVSNYGRFDGT